MPRSMIIKGKVTSKERFFSLLHALGESSKTGTLVVVDGDVERRLFFEDGKIVSTASTTTIESFGHFLLERAFIQESTLSQLQSKPDALLGQELVEIGAMSEDEVKQALRLKIKSTITDICSSPEGKFEFAKESLGDKKRVSVAFDVLDLMSAEGVTEEPEAREFRVDSEQTDRFEAVRDGAPEERADKEKAAKEAAVKDDAIGERTDKYKPVKDSVFEEKTSKYKAATRQAVEDHTDKVEPVTEQTQKLEAVQPGTKAPSTAASTDVGEDSLLEAFEKIKKIKSAKSREEKKEPALPLIPVPTGPIRKSIKEDLSTETPEDTEAPKDTAATMAEAPAQAVEEPKEEPAPSAPAEPEEGPVVVEEEIEEDVPVVVEEEIEEDVPVAVEEEIEEEVPDIVEDEAEEDVPVVAEEEAPVVIEEEGEDEAPIAAEDEEPAVVPDDELPSDSVDTIPGDVEVVDEEVVQEPVMAAADTDSTIREQPVSVLPEIDEKTVEELTLKEPPDESPSPIPHPVEAPEEKVHQEAPSPAVLEPTLSEPAVEAPRIVEPEVSAPVVAPKAREPKPAPVITPIATPGHVIPRRDSSKLPLIGAAIIAVVLVSLGGFWFLGGSGGEESVEQPSQAAAPSTQAAEDTSQVADSDVGSDASGERVTPSDPAPQQTVPTPARTAPPPRREPAGRAPEPTRGEAKRTTEVPARTPPPSRPVVETPEPAQPPPTERAAPGSKANVDQAPKVVDEGASPEPAPGQPAPKPEPPPASASTKTPSPTPAKPSNNAGQQQPASSGWGNAIFAPQPKINVASKNDQPTVQRGALVEPGSDVIDPVLLEHPELKYPKEAKKEKIERVVQVRVLVDENGNVVDAKIDKPVGYGLDEAALEVARKARFMPATKGSVQVKMWTTLPLAYRLK